MAAESWESLVARKQAEVAAQIPEAWRLPAELTKGITETSKSNVLDVPRKSGLLSEKQLEITENYDATDLLAMMAKGELTSCEVTQAFCIRAAIAGQVIHCTTEMFFDQALTRAKELDQHLATTGKTKGPLHGLPICVKDSFNIKGVASTIGYTSFIAKGPEKENSILVETLFDLGAVLYVKSNLPQTIMTGDSHNWIFGRTLNPHNTSLTAGGSSGGEGALMAMGGSVLGIGTDIAGSIRIPGLCNGVFAFKPSTNRIPYGKQTSSAREGLAGFAAAAGPLARSPRDLELLTSAVLKTDPSKRDPTASFTPWRSVEKSPGRKLRLGLIVEDPTFPLHPPVMRALNTAVDKLKEAGHTIIPLTDKVPNISETLLTAFRFFGMDPKKIVFSHIDASGEPRIPSLATAGLPQPHFPHNYIEPTLENLIQLNVKRGEVKEAYRKLVVENELDAFILPGFSGTAVKHDLYGLPPYTTLFNLLDYPAVSIPFEKASKSKDASLVRDVPYYPPYDADLVEGAPCAVQVAGRNLQDEELLRDVEIIAGVLDV